MTPDKLEAVHNFIRFSMEAQEKMGKHLELKATILLLYKTVF